MKDKRKFSLACIIAFTTMAAMYLVVSISGYLTFGTGTETNIIRNLGTNGLSIAINICMICHVLCAFLIVINVVNLSLEDYFRISHCQYMADKSY